MNEEQKTNLMEEMRYPYKKEEGYKFDEDARFGHLERTFGGAYNHNPVFQVMWMDSGFGIHDYTSGRACFGVFPADGDTMSRQEKYEFDRSATEEEIMAARNHYIDIWKYAEEFAEERGVKKAIEELSKDKEHFPKGTVSEGAFKAMLIQHKTYVERKAEEAGK